MFDFINFRLAKMDAWHGNLKVAQIDNDARICLRKKET
jgi:hypothetical protein